MEKNTDREVSEFEIVQILNEILFGLKTLHDLGYMHRDIKPANVLLSEVENGNWKLCDYNLSRKL